MRDVWVRRFIFMLAGGLIGLNTPEAVRIVLLVLFLFVGFRLWLWKAKDFFGQLFRPELLLISAGFLVGVLYGYAGHSGLESPLTLNNVQVTGTLKDWNQSAEGATGVFRVKTIDFGTSLGTSVITPVEEPSKDSSDFRGKVYGFRVYNDRNGKLPETWSRVVPGDELSFKAKLEHPKPPGTPGQFDLPLYYAVRGQAGNLTAQGDAELLQKGRSPYLWRIRERVRELLERWPPEKTGILEGILFGDSSRIPQEDLERYKITGVLHVFSASGSNVAFVLAIFWGVLQFLPPTLRVLLTSSMLIFYAILCGGNPPIVRATLMGIFALMGRLGQGKVNSLRNLLLVGVLLFLWQPLILRDTGFQLSFLATWGIVVLVPKLSEQTALARLPKLLRLALTVTLAAQIATLPILITAFHRLSFIGLFANLAVLLVLGSVFELGLIGVLLSFSAFLAMPLFQVSLWLLEGVNVALRFFAQLPGADVWALNPGVLFWLVWYGGWVVFLVGKKRSEFIFRVWLRKLKNHLGYYTRTLGHPTDHLPLGERRPKIFCDLTRNLRRSKNLSLRWVGSLVVLLLLWSPWNNRGEVIVSFIDVGQGDSILIETPKHHAILIDTGPKSERFDAGERIVLPYLLEKRIKHLDALLLTHPHEDHVGGALFLLNNLPVDWVGVPDDGQAWDNGGAGSQGLFTKDSGLSPKQNLKGYASADASLGHGLSAKLSQMKVNRLKAGDQVVLDSEVVLKVLGPGNVLSNTHSDANNNSIVLKLEYGGQNVLLGADMETEEMQEIVRSGQDFASDYFKEPHHGSRFSLNSDYLDSINPKGVFVSVGRNTFGHPDPKVLQYWEGRHIPLYRTDERGTIELKLYDKVGQSIVLGR